MSTYLTHILPPHHSTRLEVVVSDHSTSTDYDPNTNLIGCLNGACAPQGPEHVYAVSVGFGCQWNVRWPLKAPLVLRVSLFTLFA